jgi:hypothetical protein
MNTSKRFTPTEMASQLPPGLERYTIRCLEGHIGRDQAISRGSLLIAVQMMPGCSTVSDRQLRLMINILRKKGCIICSSGGEEGGYWVGSSWNEVEEYVERELNSRIVDLAETKAGILRGAQEQWGEGVQGRLF